MSTLEYVVDVEMRRTESSHDLIGSQLDKEGKVYTQFVSIRLLVDDCGCKHENICNK